MKKPMALCISALLLAGIAGCTSQSDDAARQQAFFEMMNQMDLQNSSQAPVQTSYAYVVEPAESSQAGITIRNAVDGPSASPTPALSSVIEETSAASPNPTLASQSVPASDENYAESSFGAFSPDAYVLRQAAFGMDYPAIAYTEGESSMQQDENGRFFYAYHGISVFENLDYDGEIRYFINDGEKVNAIAYLFPYSSTDGQVSGEELNAIAQELTTRYGQPENAELGGEASSWPGSQGDFDPAIVAAALNAGNLTYDIHWQSGHTAIDAHFFATASETQEQNSGVQIEWSLQPNNTAISNTTVDDTETIRPVASPSARLTSRALSKVYDDNTLAADIQLTGQDIEVSGRIESITRDEDDTPIVTFEQRSTVTYGVICQFADVDVLNLIGLKKGDSISIIGHVTGTRDHAIVLDNCRLAQ